MPRFSEEVVDRYLDSFFSSLPDSGQYKSREIAGVYYALTDDSFREEIASPMADVMALIEMAEEFIDHQLNNHVNETPTA